MTKILAIQGSDLKKVNIKTDTTILLASEAQKRGYQIYYFEPENLSFLNGKVIAACKHIKIRDNKKKFYSTIKAINFNLEKKIIDKIIIPTLKAIKDLGENYKGFLYAGLMIKNNEPYLVE